MDTLDATVLDRVDAESVFVETNGVRLHTVQAGPNDGPLVVLLHGFPECWYGWHRQLDPLAKAGYRVVAVDQRGYNLSDKPSDVSSYHIRELAADIAGLVDALGYDKAAVAGHDWGAAVAWWLALEYPDRLSRLCIVNVPHPTVFERTLRTSWSQRKNSWYVGWFQVPYLPELTSRLGNYWLLADALTSSSRPDAFTETDIDRYRLAWSQPGALTGMVNWYRAIVRARPQPVRQQVDVPTRILWGADDEYLDSEMAHRSIEYCTDGEIRMVDGATHWILHEEPALVVETLLDLLASPQTPRE